MNYIFKGVSYDQEYLSPMPTILAEVEIIPSTPKEWRDIHQVINSTNFEEISKLASMFNSRPNLPNIKNVYFNNPVTVVLWDDGTKTIVRCQDGDTYSKETGLALCMAKKAMGNKSNFNDIFKKWIPEEKKTTVTKNCLSCEYRGCSAIACLICDADYSEWEPREKSR